MCLCGCIKVIFPLLRLKLIIFLLNFFFPADQWLDQTIHFSTNDIYAAAASPILRSVQQQPIKVEHTAQLLREFDSVFDAVELTHLTPPQTPPQSPPIDQYPNYSKQVISHQIIYKKSCFLNNFFLSF